MFRFVHIADIHLDSPVSCRTEQARRRLHLASQQALAAAIDLALSRQADALLIAGDLFDDDTVSFQAERLLCSEFARLGDVPVIYVTGNHDPGGSRARKIKWPDNVHLIAAGDPETIVVSRAGNSVGAVTGIGHSDYQIGDNLVMQLPPASGDLPQAALVHAWIAGVRSGEWHSRYAPAAQQDLQSKGYDYWALGHVHRQQQVGSLPAYYPGNIQGRNSGETGPRGGLYVEIDRGEVQVEFIPLAPIRWELLELTDVRDVVNWTVLRDTVQRQFQQVSTAAGGRQEWILVVKLSGQCPLYEQLMDETELYEVEQDLAVDNDVLEVQVRSSVRRPLTVEEYRQGVHTLASVLSVLERAAVDDAVLTELLPQELAQSPVTDRLEYGRLLLEGLDEEAVARMVGDQS